jgi:hypothetical protein
MNEEEKEEKWKCVLFSTNVMYTTYVWEFLSEVGERMCDV